MPAPVAFALDCVTTEIRRKSIIHIDMHRFIVIFRQKKMFRFPICVGQRKQTNT